MTNAQHAESLLRTIAGDDLHLKNMQEEGNPFSGCFGFECPEGHRTFSDDDCDSCPYYDYWEKEVSE